MGSFADLDTHKREVRFAAKMRTFHSRSCCELILRHKIAFDNF
jgi:hypothetical protein